MPFGVLVRIQSWAQILNPVVKHWIFFYFPNQTCLNEVEIKKNPDLHRRWISYLCIEKTYIDHQTKEFTTRFDNPKKNPDLHRRWISCLCIEKTYIDHQIKEVSTGFDNPIFRIKLV